MAFEAYSERARQVIFIARHIAGRHGSPLIHLDHLLLAIIYEDQGEISSALSDAPGLQHLPALRTAALHEPYFPAGKATQLRRKLEESLPRSNPLPSSAEIPLSPQVKHTLGSAADLLSMLGQHHVEPIHLLTAILKEGSSHGASLLRESGTSEQQLMEAIPLFSRPQSPPSTADRDEKRSPED